jgi:hypothetical protein
MGKSSKENLNHFIDLRIKDFYREMTAKLSSINLFDSIKNINPFLLRIKYVSGDASKVVEEIINKYLSSQEEEQLQAILAVNSICNEDKEFFLKVIRPSRHFAGVIYEEFNEELDALRNRFTGQFIKQFCDQNGYINWEKLTAFISFKNED